MFNIQIQVATPLQLVRDYRDLFGVSPTLSYSPHCLSQFYCELYTGLVAISTHFDYVVVCFVVVSPTSNRFPLHQNLETLSIHFSSLFNLVVNSLLEVCEAVSLWQLVIFPRQFPRSGLVENLQCRTFLFGVNDLNLPIHQTTNLPSI